MCIHMHVYTYVYTHTHKILVLNTKDFYLDISLKLKTLHIKCLEVTVSVKFTSVNDR